ncbi:MAG: PilZ domain-containing protein [Pseudolabrys sp.]
MFPERRQTARVRFNRGGLVQHDRIGTRSCTIVNISEGGARLCTEADLPSQFVLTMKTDEGERRKTCRLVWRLHQEFGVQFLD